MAVVILLPLAFVSIVSLALSALLVVCYLRARFFVPKGLRNVPGPEPTSIAFGNIEDVWSREIGVTHSEWFDTYGSVVRYTSLLGEQVLLLGDPSALNHVLRTRAYDWPKSEELRTIVSRLLGKGLFWAEGDDHKRMKRIMQPAFSPSALRGMLPTFLETTAKMADIWDGMIERNESDSAHSGADMKHKQETVVNTATWMPRLTLDLIGLAGFGTDINALGDPNGPLPQAFRGLFPPMTDKPSAWNITIATLATQVAHWISFVPIECIQLCGTFMNRLNAETARIVARKRQERREAIEHGEDLNKRVDLITLLIKSNEGEGKHQLTDAELQAQMATLSVAGHDATASAMSLMLYRLAKHPWTQTRLRAEILEARQRFSSNDRHIEAEELDSLPYLNAFVRESIRLEPSVPMTARIATRRDVLPLSEPLLGRDGKTYLTEIVVEPGQQVIIPIAAYNRRVPSGNDFVPERWLDDKDYFDAASPNSPTSPSSMLSPLSPKTPSSELSIKTGVFGNVLTFVAGPRACIGWKFALYEMKALLYELVPRFEFEERSAGQPVARRTAVLTRTVIEGDEHLGPQMPLRIRKLV